MKYVWEWLPSADIEKVTSLVRSLKIYPVIANLFISRGIEDEEAARHFFQIKLENLHNPSLMSDMGIAAYRVAQAKANGEKVMIWGDYDVDGTTGTALLMKGLKKFFPDLTYYIPDRYTEGYGISMQGIDYAAYHGISLIISVDCGIKNTAEIEYARSKNIDFIVFDHHTPGEQLPPAVAVVDPKRQDDNYPFKELTGCGVAFKFLQYFYQQTDNDVKSLYNFLDLLALSIAADIVPVVDENRILAYYGLKVLNRRPSVGLAALKEVAGWKNRTLTIGSLVFSLAPRINAAGRIGHGSQAVELLISEDYDSALDIARQIDKLNRQRQNIQSSIVKDILRRFDDDPELKNRNSTVLYNPDWHKGVVGIAASKIIETYYRPTIILTKSEDGLTGSARSVADFDLYEAIDECSQWLTKFGGHKYAAGLSLKPENLEKFTDCFEKVVSRRITEDMKKPRLKIAGELRFDQINDRLMRILKKMEPYGPGNPRPVFVTRKVRDTGYSRIVGRENNILLLQLEDASGRIFTGIHYGNADLMAKINTRKPFDIAYTVEENNFNGKTSIQLEIRDFAF